MLESWRTLRFLMSLQMVSDRLGHSLEALVKFSSRLDFRNLVKTPSVLLSFFLESKRTWRFLLDLEMVSDRRGHPFEASVKVSSRFDMSNPVKNPPVLLVSSWSLGGH